MVTPFGDEAAKGGMCGCAREIILEAELMGSDELSAAISNPM